MEAFLTSISVVALAEVGDKTQLLAIVLATRLQRPVPIILGIFVATLANHALAALVGAEAAAILDGRWFRIAVAISFVAMGLWTLVPDKLSEGERREVASASAFVTTAIAFFTVEMGDKTQIATAALGARFQDVPLVAAGTTLGMLIANVPAVLLGNELLRRIPLKFVRIVAALLFIAIGAWLLIGLAVAR